MKEVNKIQLYFIFIICNSGTITHAQYPPTCDSPIYCYGNLLNTVQMARLYSDSKTFVDMKMKNSQNVTLRNFEILENSTKNNPTKEQIQQFVLANFEEGNELDNYTLPDFNPKVGFLQEISNITVRNFTEDLINIWPQLSRKVKQEVYNNVEQYSFIPVPNGFVIPGGRFREYYYWDSYWIIDGLLLSEMYETARGMIDNFLTLVKQFGFIPNGGRIYYLRRSQPPLLTSMAYLYFKYTNNITWLRNNVDTLAKELSYWDNQTVQLKPLLKTYTLAHYNAVSSGPRPESYPEDVATASYYSEDTEQERVYINLKSGAESGWDFSSRWIFNESGGNNANLSFIQTSRVIPVDLNAFLCGAYRELSQLYSITGHPIKSLDWRRKYEKMRDAVQNVLWNHEDKIWYDFDMNLSQHRKYFYPSNLAPLWAKCFESLESDKIAESVTQYLQNNKIFDYLGGIPTSEELTGQQWDLPNAWPPEQDIVIRGLENLNHTVAHAQAVVLAKRWVNSNILGFRENGTMFEKYDANVPGQRGGGGEYEPQFGFGWSNGVALRLIYDYFRNNDSD